MIVFVFRKLYKFISLCSNNSFEIAIKLTPWQNKREEKTTRFLTIYFMVLVLMTLFLLTLFAFEFGKKEVRKIIFTRIIFWQWNWRTCGKLTENRFLLPMTKQEYSFQCAHSPSSTQFKCHQFHFVIWETNHFNRQHVLMNDSKTNKQSFYYRHLFFVKRIVSNFIIGLIWTSFNLNLLWF